MNYLKYLADFSTVEEGEAAIKAAEALRDKMGGALYWGAINDDVEALKNKLFILKLKTNKQ